MSILLLLAANLLQEEAPEIFAYSDGWQIARAGTGCLMTQEFGGDGNTILTLSIDPELVESPLQILVGNSLWVLPEADDEGYSLAFSESKAGWTGLIARTFRSENEDGSVDGVISLAFTRNAMTPVLEDMAAADLLRLSRNDRLISAVSFTGTEAAIRSLSDCVSSLP